VRSDPCEMFRALAVETRLRIFELVKSKGPIGVKRIAELMAVTPAAVSQHLKVLKHAGLVRNERKGYWIPYSIDEQALERCRGALNRICSCGWRNHPGHHAHHRHEIDDSDLESLLEYEKRIKAELAEVRKRIDEMKRENR
jgi:DNA-binding transcriptional ArsR family regulator